MLTTVLDVPKAKALWTDQGAWMCWWVKAMGLQDQGEETSTPTISMEWVTVSVMCDGCKVTSARWSHATSKGPLCRQTSMSWYMFASRDHLLSSSPARWTLTYTQSSWQRKMAKTSCTSSWWKPCCMGCYKQHYCSGRTSVDTWLNRFCLNPYDECVANKVIDGMQCTILWHVDDLKISHAQQAVLEGIINDPNGWYGKITLLTMMRGDIHDYLGMTTGCWPPLINGHFWLLKRATQKHWHSHQPYHASELAETTQHSMLPLSCI